MISSLSTQEQARNHMRDTQHLDGQLGALNHFRPGLCTAISSFSSLRLASVHLFMCLFPLNSFYQDHPPSWLQCHPSTHRLRSAVLSPFPPGISARPPQPVRQRAPTATRLRRLRPSLRTRMLVSSSSQPRRLALRKEKAHFHG